MKAIDIVLPPAKTEQENFNRWQNRLQSELQTLPYYKKTKIGILAVSITTNGEVSWGKDRNTSQWVAGVSFGYD